MSDLAFGASHVMHAAAQHSGGCTSIVLEPTLRTVKITLVGEMCITFFTRYSGILLTWMIMGLSAPNIKLHTFRRQMNDNGF